MERKHQESISEKGNIVPDNVMSELNEVQIEEMQNRIDFMGDLRKNMVKEIVGDLSVYTKSN